MLDTFRILTEDVCYMLCSRELQENVTHELDVLVIKFCETLLKNTIFESVINVG
jgi:hypothetical protein